MTNLEIENNRMIDVVDENDAVVDSKLRTEIHRLGLPHREIHIWMFDESKNVFFQKRGLHSASAGSLDATIGGHVNAGEDYLEAAVREAKEETKMKIAPGDLIVLKKFKKLHITKDYLWGKTNNFIRTVYIYKNPIKEDQLKKELGIPGGGFQKMAYNFLLNPPKEYSKMFTFFILEEELPEVLKYLR
ncbi:MAG: NUDIX domain-containing protein [Patescibacteria group bacterium]